MKKILVLLLLLASITVAEVVKPANRADRYIQHVMSYYNDKVASANAFYKKSTVPVIERAKKVRAKTIKRAGENCIGRLKSAANDSVGFEKTKFLAQIDAVKEAIESEGIDVVNKKVTPKVSASILKTCGYKYRGHIYIAFVSNVTAKEASKRCKAMGGHLVYLETEAEIVILKHQFGNIRFWVGAGSSKEGWKWGNGKPVDKSLWLNTYPKLGGSYVLMQSRLKDATDESETSGFICEWE